MNQFLTKNQEILYMIKMLFHVRYKNNYDINNVNIHVTKV
jgi:hypothetical protein